MEDPESEWAIQEYSPPKEEETTMVRWILNKGYDIGKKMVVTGIVISSAPLVLPPLVVLSAMGFAFSVPSGFVLASYACTYTLMNKLLPTTTSSPPLLLEYYPDEDEEEDVDYKFDLHEGGDEYTYEYESQDGYEQEVEALTTYVNGDQDEKGYYTDDEEKDDEVRLENEDEKEREDEDEDDVVQREYDIEEEEREQMEDINQGIEMRLGFDMVDDEHKKTHEMSSTNSSGVDEQGYEEDDGEYLEEDDDSLQEERKDEREEIVKGSTGLLEKIRDEGKVDDTVGNGSALNEVFEDDKDVEITEPVIVKEIESQKLVKDGNKNQEVVGEMHRVMILDEGNEENNFNSREVEELDLMAREVVVDTIKEEFDDKITKDNMEKTSDKTTNDENETKKEHLINTNEDAREIGDESGLDLFDERNTNINFEIHEGGDEVKENNINDNVDVMSLPGFRHAQLDSDKIKVNSNTNKKKPSREDVLEDEKIWEKIGAMRAIVGYKAPSQPTFLGELKALYVFTGVEPPATFKGDSRDEVNAKLKFLMSVVGVK